MKLARLRSTRSNGAENTATCVHHWEPSKNVVRTRTRIASGEGKSRRLRPAKLGRSSELSGPVSWACRGSAGAGLRMPPVSTYVYVRRQPTVRLADDGHHLKQFFRVRGRTTTSRPRRSFDWSRYVHWQSQDRARSWTERAMVLPRDHHSHKVNRSTAFHATRPKALTALRSLGSDSRD